MFSGIPLGNSVNTGSAFAPATFVAGASPGTQTAIVTQASLFPGQNVLTDGRQPNIDMNMTPFMPIFGTNVSKEIQERLFKLITESVNCNYSSRYCIRKDPGKISIYEFYV